jgi:hypothetical protein
MVLIHLFKLTKTSFMQFQKQPISECEIILSIISKKDRFRASVDDCGQIIDTYEKKYRTKY